METGYDLYDLGHPVDPDGDPRARRIAHRAGRMVPAQPVHGSPQMTSRSAHQGARHGAPAMDLPRASGFQGQRTKMVNHPNRSKAAHFVVMSRESKRYLSTKDGIFGPVYDARTFSSRESAQEMINGSVAPQHRGEFVVMYL